MVGDYYEKGSMQTTQGPVRIFIPEKKGWYSIEYPYPYPLTEQKSWFIFGPRLLVVNLSSLIASVQTGQVEVAGWTDEKKDIASDIKVTFESGEGPKEKK